MKLLMVDDSKLLQERLKCAILKIDTSIVIFQAYNCRKAVELYQTSSPDTIILDISLPDGRGIDLLNRFRSDSKSTCILILTNYNNYTLMRRCMAAGANKFFDKANIHPLLEYLSKLLNSYTGTI